jgi:putative cell wall-binding protein
LAATAAHATSSFTPTDVYGANRYQSAAMSNEKAFPSGVSEVVLADGLPGHQGDALAASGYAGVNGYGILLTDNTNTVPADTMTALSTLKVKTIQPVGGTAAISSAQLAQLAAAGYTVKPSLAGATSLGTMEAIDDSIPPSSVGTSSSGLPTAFLASVDANHLVDALSAGGGAYALKFPVITTETTSSTLSPEAQQVITALGIKKLIVLGGTASVPASQYSPNPTGVTTEDTSATTGADRSTTSTLLATDLSKNYGFDNPLTSMILAAGATYVGSGPAIQNDGADALADAPLGGITKSVTIVTNGPTDIGQAGNFATANASTLDPLYVGTGPTNLPQSQVNTVVTDGGGSERRRRATP